MTPLRVVSAYRKMKAESGHHLRLGAFDWVGALEMLRISVQASCGCETVALTDETTAVGLGPVLRYPTTERRLMLWILEVSLAYVSSPAFDVDTVFVSPDTLIQRDLRPYFAGDLTILVRSAAKYHNRPILNAVQWWPVASRVKLIAFYTEALAIARTLDPATIKWGADSQSIRQLIEPITPGMHARAGLDVSMVEAVTVMNSLTNTQVRQLESGRGFDVWPVPIVDFKGPRKFWMARVFAKTQAARCT